jgi:hypothetical protein
MPTGRCGVNHFSARCSMNHYDSLAFSTKYGDSESNNYLTLSARAHARKLLISRHR